LFADRLGRRTPLMFDVLSESFVEFLTGFWPNLTIPAPAAHPRRHRNVRRVGPRRIAYDGEDPERQARVFSGLLQQDYAFGYLLAALALYIAGKNIGWRWTFSWAPCRRC
jgi:SHS family lactate transporter-like MFS transporter